jgi:hypothetical protein
MSALRRLLPEIDFSAAELPYERLAELTVMMDDFRAALCEVSPSAIRELFVDIPMCAGKMLADWMMCVSLDIRRVADQISGPSLLA